MSSIGPAQGPLALAEQAYGLVQISPRRAQVLAKRALAVASAEGDIEAEIAAQRALGWVQNVLGDTRAARTSLRAGIRLAERHGNPRSAAMLRRNFAVSLARAGQTRAAQREIAVAVASLSGRDRAQSEVHRMAIHYIASSPDPVLHRQMCADAAKALRLLRREGDEIWEARLLYNRGLLHLDRGELERAEADLRRAHELYAHVGAEAAAANAVVLLAWLALLRGEILTCLNTLENVQADLGPGELGYLKYNLDECRVLALAQARLLPEARAAAEAYVELCVGTDRGDNVAWTMLNLAKIAMASLDLVAARRFATRAARSYAARGKLPNAALARAVSLRAQLLAGNLRRSSIHSGLDAAVVLENAGWRRDALRTHLLVSRIALAVGSSATASRELELARQLRTRGTVLDRIEFCHAQALMQLDRDDRAAALRQLEAGLRLLDGYRTALGALELRATASGIGVELSQLGLRIALESSRPGKILVWAERLRGSALRLPQVRPSTDRKLSALQAELRRAAAQIRDAEGKGKAPPGIAARQARLEAAIRTRTRLVESDGEATSAAMHHRDVAHALGERVLVEYVELDGVLRALTLADGRLTLNELGPVDATSELGWLRFALARLARGGNTEPQRAALLGNARAAAAALDAALIEPLLATLGKAPLVVVPTGSLHAIPWAALPSQRGRPIVVAPSLSVWLRLDERPRSRR